MANSRDAEDLAAQTDRVARQGRLPSRTNIEVSGPETLPRPPRNALGKSRQELNLTGRGGD